MTTEERIDKLEERLARTEQEVAKNREALVKVVNLANRLYAFNNTILELLKDHGDLFPGGGTPDS